MADREGFNPCCFGLAVLARCNRAAVDPLRCFNPCCFGLAVLAKLEITGQTQESEFQSLLFWISRFGIAPDRLRFSGAPVSILVVLD